MQKIKLRLVAKRAVFGSGNWQGPCIHEECVKDCLADGFDDGVCDDESVCYCEKPCA